MARYIKPANLIPLQPCPMCGSGVFATYEERARYKYECNSCGQYFEFNAPSQLAADTIFNNIICGAKMDGEREENA